jgi:hypothetical protein
MLKSELEEYEERMLRSHMSWVSDETDEDVWVLGAVFAILLALAAAVFVGAYYS